LLFNSWEFVPLFVAVLLLYRLLNDTARRQWVLLAGSFVFYGAWDWRFLGLLVLSTVVDYTIGRLMAWRRTSARPLLAVSVAVNLGLLGTFKYFGFFVESAAALFESFGLQVNAPTLHIILPVGISFYTFQSMAYTIDVYRRHIEPERSLRLFALYVAFFPQLVAGPIETPRHLIPQLARLGNPTRHQLATGASMFLTGLLRKVVIADTIARAIDPVFSDPAAHGGATLVAAVVLFAIQIYADFAGYTDMARGIALTFGVELGVNFREPYFAVSLTDFWRRWHISLSTWLRDYLYVPLGGNRGGKVATYRNLLVTMLLGGLWHGAAWNFVIWGGMHGVGLAFERSRRDRGRPPRAGVAGWVRTMAIVTLAWIFFRAADLATAWSFVTGIATWRPGVDSALLLGALAAVCVTLLLDHPQSRWSDPGTIRSWAPARRGVYAGLAVLVLLTTASASAIPFIYFQF
jgi:D-alanyl-lipoteichoic acid acyltransferase DltB (MBOAT superfamily)